MKHNCFSRLLAAVICIALLLAGVPMTAAAEEADTAVSVIEGDVIEDFVPEGTACTSSDPSVAWVDAAGSLNALKPGTVTVSAEGQPDRTVTVADYSDGSPIAGRLKILARYNDSMQFYDGHVYLLFTSYQDGVEISVPDLYAGYEILPQYYADINEDIFWGSNHTGKDAENYFALKDGMTSVTLDRGEIVTIGMYRDFDLSVPQAALGSIQNSSLWNDLSASAKAGIVEIIFGFLKDGRLSTDEAVARIKAIVEEEGKDYTKLLDGVVGGGVCFNRELYNQKLEWDQYENVTYELDITENQLRMMTLYLGGNLNKFSILKNSCATVALRAWNAAVGTRNGAPDAYYLTSAGEGIFSVIDAPKGVRDNIVSRLPGYYLNNAAGVAEPDAGFEDETGWVYVSAPEKVAPLTFVYADDSIVINDEENDLPSLLKAAKGDRNFVYNKDAQEIGVSVASAPQDDAVVIEGVDFTVNGETVTLGSDNLPEDGVWFTAKVDNPVEGEDYYVTDADGKALASWYYEGEISFRAASLPASFRIVGSTEGAQNLLRIRIGNADQVKATTEIYIKDGDKKIALNDLDQVSSGTKIFVRPTLADDEDEYIPESITMNWENVLDDEHYDAEENAWFAVMPETFSTLEVNYEKADLKATKSTIIQLPVGATLKAADVAELVIGEDEYEYGTDDVTWQIIGDADGIVTLSGDTLTAVGAGNAVAWACAEANENIGIFFSIRVYENADEMATVTLNDAAQEDTVITARYGEEEEIVIPCSGYLVRKGSVLTVTPVPEPGKVLLSVLVNGKPVGSAETITVDGDTAIDVLFADAEITGMPEEIRLSAKGDTYQLEAAVSYTGLLSFLPVYDGTVGYESSDPLVTVDETGLVTVAGDVPEDGAAVYIKAFAGSEDSGVSAKCRVVVGDYQGDRIVGSITISARRIYENQLVAHGALTFTTYEDVDLDVSYYHYNRPNDKYNDLMIDYEQHPENYTADPALYSNNVLGLEDRESYFDTTYHGEMSDPALVSLLAGESISLSNYGFDASNLSTLRKALEGALSSSAEVRELVRQMKLFEQGEAIDGAAAFDAAVATLAQMFAITGATGYNPADGRSIGGMDINREMYNQFRRDDSQMPNNYYTVEITADELAVLKSYLADPQNNYYNLFNKNCASGAVDVWNSILANEPELQLTSNLSGLGKDPQSLFFELGALNLKKQSNPNLRGEGGTDFYPRSVRYSDALKEAMAKIDAIGEVEYTDESKERIDAAREAYDALNDAEKARLRNYDVLADAEEAYDAFRKSEEDENRKADHDAFNAYKAQKLAEVDTFASEDDSFGKKLLLTVAKALISVMDYDDSLSLDENKAAVDAIVELVRKSTEDPQPVQTVLLGDVDGDGVVTVIDATYIQRKLADLPVASFNEAAADTDGDGEVTVIDATYIQRWLAGLPSSDLIGQPIEPVVPPVPNPTEATSPTQAPDTNPSGLKTVGEVLTAYPDIPFFIDPDKFVCIAETDDHVYYFTAASSEDLFDAVTAVDYQDPQYKQKTYDLLKNVPITSCEDIKPQILSQEALNQYIGKKGQALFDDGFIPCGESVSDDGILTMSFDKGFFEYEVTFSEKVNGNDENFEAEKACKSMTISGAKYDRATLSQV